MILKLIIITILILSLFYLLHISLENFSNKNYINTEIIPLEYNQIYSSIPYDIKLKNENSAFYDYGNDELNEKFAKIFDINNDKLIKYAEGVEWTKWKLVNETNYSNKLDSYSNLIINEFNKNLDNPQLKLKNNPNFKLIKNKLNRFKTSTDDSDIVLMDIDIIIYRQNRPLARHIKIVAVSNGIYVNFLFIKVIGVINECNLNETLIPFDLNNKDLYTEFVNDKYILYDLNSFIYDTNDRLVNSSIQSQLYYKLLKDLK
jgi:hypothetical protein